jgi:aarF domain-containing kinase
MASVPDQPIRPARRFVSVAWVVARVYVGYKLLQALGRLGLTRGLAARYRRHHRHSAVLIHRLATRLEGLPIKACQFLGSRADVLPHEYVDVLSTLQDRVPARPLAVVRPLVERALGCPLEEAFPTFASTPIAAASLAQVHEATVADGRRVAVKVQYPNIRELVAVDLRNIAFFIRWLARLERNFDFRVVLDEVARYVPRELDFVLEGKSAETVARSFAGRDDIVVPGILWEYTRDTVLVMEFMSGVRVTDVPALEALGIDKQRVAELLIEAYCEQILVHGFFHADPHPGNVLVQPGPRLVFLDFGLAKDFPPHVRDGLVRLTVAILSRDEAAMGAAFAALGFRTRDGSSDTLVAVGDLFLGYAARTGKAYADAEMIGHFSEQLPQLLRANPIVQVPGDVLLVVRVMGLLSGIGKQLDSRVDIGTTIVRTLAAGVAAR